MTSVTDEIVVSPRAENRRTSACTFDTNGQVASITSSLRSAASARTDGDTPCAETWDGRPVWFHGDVAAGNLLVRDGKLAAVIDFGTCGVGDPACDLVIAWTMLTGRSRAVFRERAGAEDGIWARARGWALWKALIQRADATDPTETTDQQRVITEVLIDAGHDNNH